MDDSHTITLCQTGFRRLTLALLSAPLIAIRERPDRIRP
jgi:hypothetical protein